MLMNFFYPQEMKDAIYKLEHDGKLNHQALRSYKLNMYTTLLLIPLSVIMIYFIVKVANWPVIVISAMSITIILLTFYFIKYDAKILWETFFSPYLNGKIRNAVIQNYFILKLHLRIYAIEENKRKIMIPVLLNFILPTTYTTKIAKGVSIQYFEDKNRNRALKDYRIMQRFCLDKSIFEQ